MSGNKDDLYFADGIQDEILSKLSKVPQLRVISRTSVMRYGRGERQDLRSIANTLGVTNVVEGTVTRVGQRVRIKTDLVDATRDQTIWSETYDRDLTDIFSIQSDVAERVASALRGKLSRDEQATIRQIPTQNLAAYDFYLRGWALYQLYRQEDNEKAIDLFKKIAANQVEFHRGHSQLTEFLMAGQRAICFTCYSHHFPVRMKKGAPIQPLMTEGVGEVGGSAMVMKGAPHPNAALLWVRWAVSEEGQKVYAQAGETPAHPKVEPLERIRPTTPYMLTIDDVREFPKYEKTWKEIFQIR